MTDDALKTRVALLMQEMIEGEGFATYAEVADAALAVARPVIRNEALEETAGVMKSYAKDKLLTPAEAAAIIRSMKVRFRK